MKLPCVFRRKYHFSFVNNHIFMFVSQVYRGFSQCYTVRRLLHLQNVIRKVQRPSKRRSLKTYYSKLSLCLFTAVQLNGKVYFCHFSTHHIALLFRWANRHLFSLRLSWWQRRCSFINKKKETRRFLAVFDLFFLHATT